MKRIGADGWVQCRFGSGTFVTESKKERERASKQEVINNKMHFWIFLSAEVCACRCARKISHGKQVCVLSL